MEAQKTELKEALRHEVKLQQDYCNLTDLIQNDHIDNFPDEDILEDLSPCGLRSSNFENLDLPGWVGGGRIEAQRQLVEDF